MFPHPLYSILLRKLYESKTHGRIRVTTDSAIHNRARILENIGKLSLCYLRCSANTSFNATPCRLEQLLVTHVAGFCLPADPHHKCKWCVAQLLPDASAMQLFFDDVADASMVRPQFASNSWVDWSVSVQVVQTPLPSDSIAVYPLSRPGMLLQELNRQLQTQAWSSDAFSQMCTGLPLG
jgi:hypothetical protein